MTEQPEPNLFDDESRDLESEVKQIVDDPDTWMNTPNDQLGGEKPIDLTKTAEGKLRIRDLIRAVKHGMPT